MPTLLDYVPAAVFGALNEMVAPLVKSGVASPWPLGVGGVVVETTGRRSGLTREVPLVAGRLGDTIVVSTVRDGSQWIRNLEADPQARVWLSGRPRAATASVRHLPGLDVAVLSLS
jgi:hypothetical protein